MSSRNEWRQRVSEIASDGQTAGSKAWQRLNSSLKGGLRITTSLAGEAYNAALNWKNDTELSHWLTNNLSNQVATVGSKAMDAEYLRTHIGGGWHRLYDGGHSLVGSWRAVSEALPDLGALDQLGVWANEYWKDLTSLSG